MRNIRRTSSVRKPAFVFAGLVMVAALLAGCGGGGTEMTIYTSRTQSLVLPVLEEFAADTGIDITVRYGSTASLVAVLREEGENTDADVVYMAEPGGLGALAEAGLLTELPQDVLERAEPFARSPRGDWVGVSGRSKVVVYNPNRVDPAELPDSIMDFTDPQWEGRIGWAPTHGEWQALLTAIRLVEGEEAAREWVSGIQANDPMSYPNLISIVQAVSEGEVDVGFVTHYYVERRKAEEGEDFPAENYYLGNGDAGALINVSGAAILAPTDAPQAAERFVEYILSEDAQTYFAEQTREYPVAAGVEPAADLPPLESLDPPNIDLSDMADLEGTLDLLREAGVL